MPANEETPRTRRLARQSAYNKQHYALHRPEILAKKKAEREADPEGFRAAKRARYWKRRDVILAQMRRWRQKHPEEASESRRQWRMAHPEKVRNMQKAWNDAHPEENREYRRKRRAKKRGVETSDLTVEQWLEILVAFNYRCAYCPTSCWRCRKKKHRLTQDHITALSTHGNHTLHNIVPACQSCNSKKHDGPPLVPVQPLLLTLASSKKRCKKDMP